MEAYPFKRRRRFGPSQRRYRRLLFSSDPIVVSRRPYLFHRQFADHPLSIDLS